MGWQSAGLTQVFARSATARGQKLGADRLTGPLH